MQRKLMICLCLIFLSLTIMSPVSAEPSHSQMQTVVLNGIEPAPPGIQTQMLWSEWGGGNDNCIPWGDFILGSGFNPPFPANDFVIYVYCIHSSVLQLAFYQIDNWHADYPMGSLIAVREVNIDSNGEAWIHVKVGRSAPFSFEEIAAFMVAEGIAMPIRIVYDDFRYCVNSYSPSAVVGDRARISPGEPNNLRSEPSANSRKIALIPAGAEIAILGGPVCDNSNGIAFWKVRYGNLEGWTAQGDLTGNWIEKIK